MLVYVVGRLLLNLKYTEVEPKVLQILYDKEAIDISSGISKKVLYTELNNLLKSYNDEGRPTFDSTRFNEIVNDLEEWDLIKAESPKSKEIKFYERKKEESRLRYLTKIGELCVQQNMNKDEISRVKTTRLLIINFALEGTQEKETASGLGSIYLPDQNYKKRLYSFGKKKEGIGIEEFLKIINDDSEQKLSYEMIKAIFDLLEDTKIIIPDEIDEEKRFRINIIYGPIISKIGQLFDVTLNFINAKWKLEPLDQMEEKWYISMFGKTYFTRKNVEIYDRRKTIKEFERRLTQSQVNGYGAIIEKLENQIEEIILNSSGDLKRYSILFYKLLSMHYKNNQNDDLRD